MASNRDSNRHQGRIKKSRVADWKPSARVADEAGAGATSRGRPLPSSFSSKASEARQRVSPQRSEDDGAGRAARPPGSNRGVVSYPVRYGLDWLKFSKPNHSGDFQGLFGEIKALLTSTGETRAYQHGYAGVEVAGYGFLGARKSHLGGHDLLVDLPAQALEYARETLSLSDQQLCRFFLEKGFKAKRCDVAADSEDPSIDPAVVFRHLESPHVCCEAENKRFVQAKSKIGEKARKDGAGCTCYIGSRTSTRFMRVLGHRVWLVGAILGFLQDRQATELKKAENRERRLKQNAA